MKRVGHLYEKLISKENALAAIEEVNKTHRTSHGKPNKTVLWVEINKEQAADELIQIIVNGYVPGEARHRIRYDYSACKNRDIYEPQLWPDQYIHHMIIQVLQPIIMRGMDHWCCSSIKGRGTSYGIKGIKQWLDYDIENTQCAAEADIHHFYDSLKPHIVMKFLKRLIKDKKMLEVVERLLMNGIMIGAFFSQWFANMVLEQLDHLIREKFGVKRYLRYMDNITFFAPTKKILMDAIHLIEEWLENNELHLKPNWQVFYPDKRMINALGYRFGRGYMIMRKKNLLRLKRNARKISKKIEKHKKVTSKQASGLISRIGMLTHCNSCKIRKDNIKKGLLKTLKKVVRADSYNKYIMRIETLFKYLKRDYNITNPQAIGGKIYGISIRRNSKQGRQYTGTAFLTC